MALAKILIITALLGVWKSEQQELYLPPPDSADTNLVVLLKSNKDLENGELMVPNEGQMDLGQNNASINNGNVKVATPENEGSSIGLNGLSDGLFLGFGLQNNENENTANTETDSNINLSHISNNEFNSVVKNDEGVGSGEGKSDEPNSPDKESQFGSALISTSDSESKNTNTDSITIISDNGISSNGINIINNKDISIINGNNEEILPNEETGTIENGLSLEDVNSNKSEAITTIASEDSAPSKDADANGQKSNKNEKNSNSNIESLSRAIAGGGIPGADYPILYYIPETSFSCLNEPYIAGYFADPHPSSRCQVFHICQEDGRMDSFLCPVGTLFNQKYFVCDWWFNVECSSSNDYYTLNERIGSVEMKNHINIDDDNINIADEYDNELTGIAFEAKPETELQGTNFEFAKRTLFDGVEDQEKTSNLTLQNIFNSPEALNVFENNTIGDTDKKDVRTIITEIKNDSVLGRKNEETNPIPVPQSESENSINVKETLQKTIEEEEKEANTELGVTIPEGGDTKPEVAPSEVIKTQDLNNNNIEENPEKKISSGIENQSTINGAKQLTTINKRNTFGNSKALKSNTKSQEEDNLNNKLRAEQTRHFNSYGVSTVELKNKKGFRN